MCGIAGIVGTSLVNQRIYDALTVLQHRGQDAAGIATVQDGELFGIVGPDGAGKTTLFRILVTLLLPESGGATVLGLDVVKEYREIRRRVGYMPGTFSL